jgi:hypothetical protein
MRFAKLVTAAETKSNLHGFFFFRALKTDTRFEERMKKLIPEVKKRVRFHVMLARRLVGRLKIPVIHSPRKPKKHASNEPSSKRSPWTPPEEDEDHRYLTA